MLYLFAHSFNRGSAYQKLSGASLYAIADCVININVDAKYASAGISLVQSTNQSKFFVEKDTLFGTP